MAEPGQSIREVYDNAEKQRHGLEHSMSRAAATYQASLEAAIKLYEQCLDIANQISLFSPNESLEDIASSDLRYLLINYRLAELRMSIASTERKASILQSREHYVQYLKQLDNYDVLSETHVSLLETYNESPNTFSTAPSKDPASRREQKIKQFKEEKALKENLAQLERRANATEDDDETYRQLQLANLRYCTLQAFQALESIAQELHILSLAPPPDQQNGRIEDARERNGSKDGYSERLDTAPLSAGLKGPLLDSKGKPLRPFTLFGSKREELRNGVFRPDHSLPTMTIDEYLEEERKRGGIIDGGGPQSGIKPEVDEDDMEEADRATMKAREWDEFVEANPRGSGNTLNRG